MDHIKSLSKALSNLSLAKEAFDVKLAPLISAISNKYQIDKEAFVAANLQDLNDIDFMAKGNYEPLEGGVEGFVWRIGTRNQYILKIIETPLTNTPRDGGPSTIHINPTTDVKTIHDTLWTNKPGSQHEVMIPQSGMLQIIYHNKARSPKIVWWKLIELLDTSIMDEDEDDIDNLITSTLYAIKEMANQKREENGVPDPVREIDAGYDIYNTDNAVVLGAADSVVRTNLARRISTILKTSEDTAGIIFDLNAALSPGWLHDFIDGILYQMAVRDKGDFKPQNLGVRESTGRLCWFDA